MRRVHQENILEAISVIVENHNSAADRFQKELLVQRFTGFVLEGEPRFTGDIRERNFSLHGREAVSPRRRRSMMGGPHSLRESSRTNAACKDEKDRSREAHA